MEYGPGAEVGVAAVLKLSVNESPFFAPVTDPVNVGLGAPYILLALLADTVSVPIVDITCTLTVSVMPIFSLAAESRRVTVTESVMPMFSLAAASRRATATVSV